MSWTLAPEWHYTVKGEHPYDLLKAAGFIVSDLTGQTLPTSSPTDDSGRGCCMCLCPSVDVLVSLSVLAWVWQKVIEWLQEETDGKARTAAQILFTLDTWHISLLHMKYQCALGQFTIIVSSVPCTVLCFQHYSTIPAQTAFSWPQIFFNNNAYSRAQIRSALSKYDYQIYAWQLFMKSVVEWLLLYNRSTLLFPLLVRKEKMVLPEAFFWWQGENCKLYILQKVAKIAFKMSTESKKSKLVMG